MKTVYSGSSHIHSSPATVPIQVIQNEIVTSVVTEPLVCRGRRNPVYLFTSRLKKPMQLRIFALFLVLITTVGNAQVAPYSTRDFLNNVVEIGLSDFGLITGEDSAHLYFICIRQAGQERIENTIKNVKLYNASYRAKATRISSTRVGPYLVVLYSTLRPPVGEWKKDFYHTLSYKRGQLSTFRDKWMSDKIWSIHTAKMSVLKQAKDGIFTIKVTREAGLPKGMPLINSEGFIAGLIAESSLGKTSFRAISMKDIATAMSESDKDCRYFGMIEWQHTATRCIELAQFEALQKAKQDSLDRLKIVSPPVVKEKEEKPVADSTKKKKSHFIDFGINANYLAGPSQVTNFPTDYDSETRTFHVGLSFHFNIDKSGARRLTAKPRYGNFREYNEPGLWSTPDNNIKIVSSSYQYVEMPIVFEQRLFRARNYSMAIGAGYSPGMLFGQHYRIQDKTTATTIEQTHTVNGQAILHRLVGELYFYEFSFGRLGAIYSRDLTSYPNSDQVLNLSGTDYRPFAGRKKAWYLGVEVAIRLRGKW